MWRLAWDMFLSLAIRAVFTIALIGGVIFLVWTFQAWRTDFWKGDPLPAQLSFLLASVTTLVGAMGTFRRGKSEAGFSLLEVAAIIASSGSGHVHVSVGHAGGRTLRRFPSIESFVLGGFSVAFWAVVALWKHDTWPLRIAAIVGAVQIMWGVAVEWRAGTITSGGHSCNERA